MTSPSASSGLKFDSVSIALDGRPLVAVDRLIAPGEVLTVMGPSGSGKSTLLAFAAGFLDPVFSSGVFLAVKTAEAVADRLHEALVDGREGDPNLHAVGDDDYHTAFNSMHMFVDRFYHTGLVHNLFFVAERSEELKQDILGLLGGDLWTGTNDFQHKLLRSRQSQKLSMNE